MRKIPKEKSRSAFRIVIYILHARGVPVKKIRPTFSDKAKGPRGSGSPSLLSDCFYFMIFWNTPCKGPYIPGHWMIHSFLDPSSFFRTSIQCRSLRTFPRSQGQTDPLCLSTMLLRTNRSATSSSLVASASDRSSHCLGFRIVLKYIICPASLPVMLPAFIRSKPSAALYDTFCTKITKYFP